MKESNPTIGICLDDAVLRKCLCDGLARYAVPTPVLFPSVEKMLQAAALSVVVLNNPRETDVRTFSERGILPLVIAPGRTESLGLPSQDIFSSPLKLGALLDRITNHVARRAAPAKAFPLGPWLASLDDGTMTDKRKGTTVRLTEKERDILMKLYAQGGRIVDRQELLGQIWGYGKEIETHTLETHIYRLRQKIERDPANPQWLITEENGYRLELSDESNHKP
jgi:DNA-binding winged helix-turn-helix (wHTH) protein